MRSNVIRRAGAMVILILAGEAAFFLPFVLARVFRPTFLAVFDLTNLELGLIFSFYGMIAIGAYFFGGPIADRFSTGKLLGVSLAATGAGGFYMATFPSYSGMKWLFAFWGLTTILLFWAALIRATREIGGPNAQGKVFGLLDGGRGLVAAGMGTILVIVFAAYLPSEVEEATDAQRIDAFRKVIYSVTVYIFIVAGLCWFVLNKATSEKQRAEKRFSLEDMKFVLRLPTLWLQAVIIVCAYIGYKVTDDFSLYAKEVMGYDEVGAAQIGTLSLWVRPVVAILAGIIADRVSASRMLIICFGILALGALGMGAGTLAPGRELFFLLVVVTTSAGIFALRGLYFAITQEGKVPLKYMGTAVGIMSIIGYTPDVFAGPGMGYLLDTYPGPQGHQYIFLILSGISLLGMVAGIIFRLVSRKLSVKID